MAAAAGSALTRFASMLVASPVPKVTAAASVNPLGLGLIAVASTVLAFVIEEKLRQEEERRKEEERLKAMSKAELFLKASKPVIKQKIKEMLMKPLDPVAEKAAEAAIGEIEGTISNCGCDEMKLKEEMEKLIKENKEKIKEKLKEGFKEAAIGREAGEIAEKVTNEIEQIITDKLRACNCCYKRRG